MPVILGPPCNELVFKTQRVQRMPGTMERYTEDDPDSPLSGCSVKFDERGRCVLPDMGKYQAERVVDILAWLSKRPEWGVTIMPDAEDPWWTDEKNDVKKKYDVVIEESPTQQRMKIRDVTHPGVVAATESAANVVSLEKGDVTRTANPEA